MTRPLTVLAIDRSNRDFDSEPYIYHRINYVDGECVPGCGAHEQDALGEVREFTKYKGEFRVPEPKRPCEACFGD